VSEHDVKAICTSELAAKVPACVSSGALSFTGNDVLLLSCTNEIMDVFGRLGEDPMQNGWGAPTRRTTDITLRRNCDVIQGDRDPNDPFDPGLEWQEAPLDSFEDLGVRCAAP
jgi:hypothetical protein